MAVITMSSGLRIAECSFGQRRYDMEETSEQDGSQVARVLGPPRWYMGLSSGPFLTAEDFGVWVATVLQLKGPVNHFLAWDPMRTVPLGTMRGTLTLSGSHSAGTNSLTVTGGAGQASTTLLAGDKLQLGTGLGTSQLVVVANATANGSGVATVTVEPALRIAFSGGAAVAWDKPSAYFKLQNSSATWQYTRAESHRQGGLSADFLEAFG
jgi:hypothetical protein